MLLATLFIARNHPISILVTIILFTAVFIVNITSALKSRWIRLLFFLVILGGILVLFIYIARLVPREPIKFSNIIWIIPALILTPSGKTTLRSTPLEKKELIIYFNSFSAIIEIIRILYLLISLLIVIKLVTNLKRPLRPN